MKRITAFLLVTVLSLGISVFAFGEDISIEVDGVKLNPQQPPVIIEGRTLVPLRDIFEALGAEVDWNGENKSIFATKETNAIYMTVGSDIMIVGADVVELDVAPTIINSKTMIPARVAAEGLGCGVEWDSANKRVIITSDGSKNDFYIDENIDSEGVKEVFFNSDDGKYITIPNCYEDEQGNFVASQEEIEGIIESYKHFKELTLEIMEKLELPEDYSYRELMSIRISAADEELAYYYEAENSQNNAGLLLYVIEATSKMAALLEDLEIETDEKLGVYSIKIENSLYDKGSDEEIEDAYHEALKENIELHKIVSEYLNSKPITDKGRMELQRITANTTEIKLLLRGEGNGLLNNELLKIYELENERIKIFAGII